jgi:hypothetical protein
MPTNHCAEVQEELYAELHVELPAARAEEPAEELDEDDNDPWTYFTERAR